MSLTYLVKFCLDPVAVASIIMQLAEHAHSLCIATLFHEEPWGLWHEDHPDDENESWHNLEG